MMRRSHFSSSATKTPSMNRASSTAVLFPSAFLSSSTRQMRIRSSTTSSSNPSTPKIAQVSDVSKPVKLSDDFTPFPLPRYDDISGLEPSPLKNTTAYDADRMMSRRKQLLLDEMFPSGTESTEEDKLTTTTTKDETSTTAISNQQQEMNEDAEDQFAREHLAFLKYAREPSENPQIFDRNFCLRPVSELVVSLKTPHPSIHRNIAALDDITEKIMDFLTYAKRDMTSYGLEEELQAFLDRTPQEDIETRSLIKKIFDHRRESHDTCLEDFLLVGKTLREMFIGGSLSLNFRKYRISADSTLPTWENERTARKSFFKFFGHAQSLMTQFVIPILSTLNNNNNNNNNNNQIEPEKVALLLECISEYLRLLAHFQLLDHERHFTNYSRQPSARLTKQIDAVQRNFWTSKSGIDFLDELTMIVMLNSATGTNDRLPRYSDDENENGANQMMKFSPLLSVVPTKTLAEWFFFFTSSYMRLDNWLARHVEFSQVISTELIQHRLLPACKSAFGQSRGKDASMLFLDHDEFLHQQPLLGIVSGMERSKLISDLLVSCAVGDITLPSDFLEQALLDGALVAAQQQQEQQVIVSPNFLIGMVKLFGGAGAGNIPLQKMFKLIEIELTKFRSSLELATLQVKNATTPEERYEAEERLLSLQHQEHDWISAVYEVAFSTEERAASLHFLEKIKFTKETLLKHVYRFADPNGGIEPDFNADEVGIFDDDFGEIVERNPAKLLRKNKQIESSSSVTEVSPARLTSNGVRAVGSYQSDVSQNLESGNSELYIRRDGTSTNVDTDDEIYFPTLEEVLEKSQSILQQALLPGAKNNKQLAEYMLENDELTVASSIVPKARAVFVLHPSFVSQSNNDALKDIIERCHVDHALLVVPSYTLFQLAAFTADTGSRSGRLSHEDLKKESLRAIFTELVEGRAFVVTPEEEVVIRFHEGHADADTLIWETCSFLQTRAPMTAFWTLVEGNHRAALKEHIFNRPLLSSTRFAGQSSSAGGSAPPDVLPHPLMKNIDTETLSKHMRRSATGTLYQFEAYSGDEMAGRVWEVLVDTGMTEIRNATQRKVLDPRGSAFMPGQFFRGGRADKYAQAKMNNVLPGVDGQKMIRRNRIPGHHQGRLLEDLSGLGVYAPDQGEV